MTVMADLNYIADALPSADLEAERALERVKEAVREVYGMASSPGFATASGEPREACEEIVKVLSA